MSFRRGVLFFFLLPVSCTPGKNCGDNQLQSPEQCDDGNQLAGDGCDSLCQQENISFSSFTPQPFLRFPTKLTTSDFNQDGNVDVIVINEAFTTISLLSGVGDGTLGVQQDISVDGSPRQITSGDFNGDGFADIALTRAQNNNIAVLSGVSGGVGAPADVALNSPGLLVAGDVNADGLDDLFVESTLDNSLRVLLSSGTTFTEVASLPLAQGAGALKVADVNQDGDLDALVALNNETRLFLGQGDGSFTTQILPGVDSPFSLSLGNFNADGALDFFIGSLVALPVLVLSDGVGGFQSSTPVGVVSPLAAVGDMSGDGLADIIITDGSVLGADGTFGAVSVFVNDGSAGFGAPVQLPFHRVPFALEAVDLDADGALDIVSSNPNSDDVVTLLGDGTGALISTAILGDEPVALLAEDLNGDGVEDFVTANRFSNDLVVRLNSGGTPGAPVRLVVGEPPVSLASTDLNDDGALDLITANRGLFGNKASIFLGSGDGSFQAPQSLDTGLGQLDSVVAGDFNGDGTPDLVLSASSSLKFAPNLGDGTFGTLINSDLGTFTSPIPIRTSDLDADGDLDIILAQDGGTLGVVVSLGGGDGTFSAAQSIPLNSQPVSLQAADLDNDGNIDLVVLQNTAQQQQQIAILRGLGGGSFAAEENIQVGLLGGIGSLLVVDLSGDGVLDLASTNSFFDLSVLVGQGGARFAPVLTFGSPSPVPTSLVTGDFNSDGRIDLATTHSITDSITIFNRQ